MRTSYSFPFWGEAIFKFGMVTVLSAVNNVAVAQEICGDQPRQLPAEQERRLGGELQGKANLLSKLMGHAELDAKVNSSRRELYQQFNNIDRATLDQKFLWTMCQHIMSNPWLSFDQKYIDYTQVYATITGQSASRNTSPAPQSLQPQYPAPSPAPQPDANFRPPPPPPRPQLGFGHFQPQSCWA
jgi:hypothetical protein